MAAVSTSRPGLTWFCWLIHFLLIFVLVGESVPGINESHYLPKAKHAWDSSFATGDLFLESANSHGLFSFFAGNLAKYMPLTAVAWVGRVGCWGLAALAWLHFGRAMGMPALISPLIMASWILAIAWGNWAGEWAVGGFEAKSVAYPIILLALTAFAKGRWNWVWIWLGLATAWHPIVGGWAGLSVAVAWAIFFRSQARLSQHFPAVCLGAAVAMVGLVPAATGLSGPPLEGRVVASQIHVFLRLAHHQTPRLFAPERHFAAGISLSLLAVATLLVLNSARYKLVQKPRNSDADNGFECIGLESQGMLRLFSIAWISVAISLVGLAIDLLLSPYRPSLAASLLRFYWFRWSDVIVPLTWTVGIWSWAASNSRLGMDGSSQQNGGFTIRQLCTGVLTLSTVFGIGWTCIEHNSSAVPPADRRLMPDYIARSPELEELVYEDWKDVCKWIDQNTPKDSLWLTPRYQQTFKWYAGRAEVVSWKDVPQDNRSLFQWYERYLATAPPVDSQGKLRGWTTAELKSLSERFGFKWIVVDRRIQREPPAFELLYPKDRLIGPALTAEDRTYAVFRIP